MKMFWYCEDHQREIYSRDDSTNRCEVTRQRYRDWAQGVNWNPDFRHEHFGCNGVPEIDLSEVAG